MTSAGADKTLQDAELKWHRSRCRRQYTRARLMPCGLSGMFDEAVWNGSMFAICSAAGRVRQLAQLPSGRSRLSVQSRERFQIPSTQRRMLQSIGPFPCTAACWQAVLCFKRFSTRLSRHFLGLPHPELVPASFTCTTTNQGFQRGALHLHCSSSLSVGSKLLFHPRAVNPSLYTRLRRHGESVAEVGWCAASHTWNKIAVLRAKHPLANPSCLCVCIFT